jgi:hypothetical protein
MRQKLRELSSLAYDRELNQGLDELYIKFHRWKSGEIDGLQLHDLIHEYHNREGKEIWKIYNQTNTDLIVTRAYRLGILTDDEIPADVKDVLYDKE